MPQPPDPSAGPDVRRMFAGVAPRYDLLNRALSGGVDRRWRRRTVRAALADGNGRMPRVLDVCTGTADLALAFARAGCDVVGVDFCAEMLACGERKRRKAVAGRRLRLVGADALRLPFGDSAFDVATVAFGIRNVTDPVAGLREMERVVRPGGKVVVLEFARPRAPVVGPAYLWYFRHVLPRLGSLLSPGARPTRAYAYLADTVLAFPDREGFVELMGRAGLAGCGFRPLSLGIAALYVGLVGERSRG